MRNAELEEAQAGIKTAGRNINNLRYADNTTLMAESEELKSLLMKVKVESENPSIQRRATSEPRSDAGGFFTSTFLSTLGKGCPLDLLQKHKQLWRFQNYCSSEIGKVSL